jgi:hypothetical protein
MASSINVQADATVGTLTKSGDATGNLVIQTNGNSALTINTSQNITFNGTGAFTVPVGNTAQRPSPAANGMIRYSNTTNAIEAYVNGAWANLGTGGAGGSGVIVISIPVANYPGNANVVGTYTYANTGTAIVLRFTANSTYTA